MTNYHLDKIQSNLEAFLSTFPDSDAVNSLIERLKEYESERQRQYVKADLAWKEQLPDTFPQYPKDKGLREKFRRMFNQLNKQGVSVYYDPECSDKSTEEWTLAQGEKIGFLYYFRMDKKWEIHGFTFQDEKGNVLDEFADVKSR